MRNFSVSRSNLRDAGLVHQADPDIAVGIELEVERALGMVGLLHRDGDSRSPCRSAGSSRDRNCSPKCEYQTMPSAIDDDVVRLDFFPRQIVFGDDDLGGAAGRARRGLEFEADASGLSLRLIAREIVGEFLRSRRIDRPGAGARRPAAAAACPMRPDNSRPCARTPSGNRRAVLGFENRAATHGSRCS